MACALAACLAAFAATYNDLSPYTNEESGSFWCTTNHPVVEITSATSSGISGLDEGECIDTRTFSESISNVLPNFRTDEVGGCFLIIR